ncbi:acyl-CoA dehydrogenase family protein [Chloroflexota bacterium]
MDFNVVTTEEEEKFRKEVREFIKQQAEDIKLASSPGGSYTDESNAATRRLAKKFGEKGWLSLTWPEEVGGKGEAGVPYKIVLTEEMSKINMMSINGFGLDMLAPILIAHGTDKQKKDHLIPMGKGEVFWCEGFSEPNSGSDLFSLQTRAIDEGDHFVVNGQKIWTTGAHRADWGFFLVRTDTNAPKQHLGISFLLINMKTPGVTVKPIQNMIGTEDFCETFLDDVKVPKENLVGQVNGGALVAGALLNAERSSLVMLGSGARRSMDRLLQYIKERDDKGQLRIDKNIWLRKMADIAIKAEIAGLFGQYTFYQTTHGRDITLMASTGKLFGSELTQQVTDLSTQLLGLHGQLMRGSPAAWNDGIIGETYLSSHQSRLIGGSSEIQRTTIAVRGLGLPRV